MGTRLEDQISVTGAPAAWRLHGSASALLNAMRGLRLLPRSACVVLSIQVVDRRKMAALNARFRGKNRATDVLSFEQRDFPAPKGFVFLGDIVLCAPLLRGSAEPYLAHGLLHLLGYDHERSAREAAKMASAERALMRRAFGISSGLIRRETIKSQE